MNLCDCVCASSQVSRPSGRGRCWTRSLLTPPSTWSNTTASTASTAWSCTVTSGWWGWRSCPTEWVRKRRRESLDPAASSGRTKASFCLITIRKWADDVRLNSLSASLWLVQLRPVWATRCWQRRWSGRRWSTCSRRRTGRRRSGGGWCWLGLPSWPPGSTSPTRKTRSSTCTSCWTTTRRETCASCPTPVSGTHWAPVTPVTPVTPYGYIYIHTHFLLLFWTQQYSGFGTAHVNSLILTRALSCRHVSASAEVFISVCDTRPLPVYTQLCVLSLTRFCTEEEPTSLVGRRNRLLKLMFL